MAALITSVTEFSTLGDSKTYAIAGHTAQLPRVITQKRRVPSKEGAVASMETTIVYGTKDALGEILSSKVAFSISTRWPNNIGPSQTEITDALATLKDVVASDEFTATLLSQGFIKG